MTTNLKQTFYTVKEVAEVLRVHQRTIFRYIKNKKLKAVKIGHWRIKKEDFDKFVNN
jgi:excisionase family DNA binding protein